MDTFSLTRRQVLKLCGCNLGRSRATSRAYEIYPCSTPCRAAPHGVQLFAALDLEISALAVHAEAVQRRPRPWRHVQTCRGLPDRSAITRGRNLLNKVGRGNSTCAEHTPRPPSFQATQRQRCGMCRWCFHPSQNPQGTGRPFADQRPPAHVCGKAGTIHVCFKKARPAHALGSSYSFTGSIRILIFSE